MRDVAQPCGSVGVLIGILFEQSNEFLDILRRNRWVHGEQQRDNRGQDDWLEVGQDVVAEVLVERRAQRHRRGVVQDGISVRERLRHVLCSDVAICTCLVVDDHWLADLL